MLIYSIFAFAPLSPLLIPLVFKLSTDLEKPSHCNSPHVVVVAQHRRTEHDYQHKKQKMSKLSTEANPQILLNGKQDEVDQQEKQADPAPAAGEQTSLVSPEEVEDKKVQTKVQSVFQQVRSQIRSQVETRTSNSGIMELMQKLKDREGRLELEGDEGNEEDIQPEESKGEMDEKQEELCEAFGKKLEATQKTLRYEMECLISQVRAESQAYTEQAIKDLECRLMSNQAHVQPQHPSQRKVPDKKQQPSASSSLASRRGRVLTRTMTTIIPKTCAPVISGPQAKSESTSLRRSEIFGPLRRDPVLALPGNRLHQGRQPILPPAHPKQQRQK